MTVDSNNVVGDSEDNTTQKTGSPELLYDVMNPSGFRAMLNVSGVAAKSVKVDDTILYQIPNTDFADECVKGGFVRVYKKNQPRRITSPENLILRIARVEKEIVGDDYTYVIKTLDGDVRITNNEITSITAWKNKFLKVGYLITFQGTSKNTEDLNDVLMYLMSTEVITSEELMTEDDMKADIFMEQIRTLKIVICDEDHVGQRNVLDADGTYVVSSKTIEGVVSELGWHHMSLNALGSLLQDHKAGNNKQTRRCGYRRSEWIFKPWGKQ